MGERSGCYLRPGLYAYTPAGLTRYDRYPLPSLTLPTKKGDMQCISPFYISLNKPYFKPLTNLVSFDLLFEALFL